jgi:hypothetical protein
VVVELQVGDHRDLRPELEEARVALVGLGDHPLALSPAGVGGLSPLAGPRELAAEEEGWIRAGRTQCPDAHRRGGGLAMRSGDGQEATARTELGEELAAVDHRLAPLASPRELGVVIRHRRGDDHLGVGWNLLRAVAEVRLDAGRSEALHV